MPGSRPQRLESRCEHHCVTPRRARPLAPAAPVRPRRKRRKYGQRLANVRYRLHRRALHDVPYRALRRFHDGGLTHRGLFIGQGRMRYLYLSVCPFRSQHTNSFAPGVRPAAPAAGRN